MLRNVLVAMLLAFAAPVLAVPIGSKYALVIDEDTGKVLFEKNADVAVPIASLTKLMTAMVVLDSSPDMDEAISIEEEDVDRVKRTRSRIPVGAALPRRTVLQLALMSSDNRAAASLARNYPGGNAAFVAAVQAKQETLGMLHTTIEEPTGLSANNVSTAADLARMAEAAAKYPDIVRMTTDSQDVIDINGSPVEYHNTNRLVGQKGWDIQLSKTGFTSAAGRCLIMRLQSAGKNVIMVLLNAKGSSARLLDAMNVRRFVAGEPAQRAHASTSKRGRSLIHFIKAKPATRNSRIHRKISS